ncbi:VOC family protein [Gorillibacterium massiliense]|uniref:VOC family protein n=1 Tax=Gorillibacterium massiliense TaxID=1280390 RepID=UPI0004AEDF78|nr:VOC family protein [Gorillibacterium massiliense]
MTLQLTPQILLDGTADEAIRFYAETLDAKVVFKQTYGEGPDPVPEAAKARISHSILSVGDSQLFVYDSFPGETVQSGNGLQICITIPDADRTRQIFEVLRQDGKVILPLKAIHFSPLYGIVADKFGVVFQLFTRRPA